MYFCVALLHSANVNRKCPPGLSHWAREVTKVRWSMVHLRESLVPLRIQVFVCATHTHASLASQLGQHMLTSVSVIDRTEALGKTRASERVSGRTSERATVYCAQVFIHCALAALSSTATPCQCELAVHVLR